jgi:hypothetical protein
MGIKIGKTIVEGDDDRALGESLLTVVHKVGEPPHGQRTIPAVKKK